MLFLRRAAVVLAALLVGLLGVVGSAHAATAVSCGSTLKANATLTKDLSCPKGNGITLYRGVTLNLGGHKLIGPGTGSGTGVTLSYKGGSVLTNGTVQGWQAGIVQAYPTAEDPIESTISKVTFVKAAVQLNTSGLVSVNNAVFTSSPLSVSSGTFAVTGSKFTSSQISVGLARMSIVSSTITAAGITNGSAGLSIDQTTMDGTGYSGAPVTCVDDSIRISNSMVKNYPKPITGWWCYLYLQTSTFSDNPGGVVLDVGYSESDPLGSLAAYGNTFVRSGIVLQSSGMIVAGNTFTGNTTGIVPTAPGTTVISGNTFSKNTSSGIRATGDGLTVAANLAINNGGYGIYAPNAVDQGGNVAYGNKRDQCVGLVCAAR